MKRAALLFVFALLAAPANAHVRPHNAWTVVQAEAIRSIRGVRLATLDCMPLGARSAPGRYRHFRCAGATAPRFDPRLRVRVRYVLHPLGRFRGPRSPFVATNVRYDSFGVP
jgi:hypothetical protein